MRAARWLPIALPLALAIAPEPLPAQASAGYPSLERPRGRIGLHATRYTYATGLGVAVTVGRTTWGTFGAGRTRDGELDASTTDLTVAAGRDIPLGARRRAFVCPLVDAWGSLGPRDFLLSGADYATVTAALGLDVAAGVVHGRAVSARASVGVRLAVEEVTITPSAYARREGVSGRGWESEVYGLLRLGVGISFRDAVTVRPEVRVPFGRSISRRTPPLGAPTSSRRRWGMRRRTPCSASASGWRSAGAPPDP